MKPARPIELASARGAESLSPPLRNLPADSLSLMEKSLKRQWKCYRAGLKGCQEKFSESAIHDTRVGARRLLSTLELLGGFLSAGRLGKVERAVKRQLDTFDELRDAQVQLPIIRKLQRTFPAAVPFYAYLMRREERLARSTRKNIRNVKTKRLGGLITACRDEIKARGENYSPERAAASLVRSVQRAFTQTCKLRARIDPNDTRTIHCTRVAFKKFRYMMETLMDYLPAKNTLREAMHDYQTMMGEIQDLEVLQRTLDKFFQKHAVPSEPARHLREEFSRRRQGLIEVYLGAADRLNEFWPWHPARVSRPPAAPRTQSRIR